METVPLLTKTSRGHRYEKLSQNEENPTDKKWWNKNEERLDNRKNELAEKQMELQEKQKLLELKKKSR